MSQAKEVNYVNRFIINDLLLELLIGFKTDLIRNYKCGKPQTSSSTFKRLAVQHHYGNFSVLTR